MPDRARRRTSLIFSGARIGRWFGNGKELVRTIHAFFDESGSHAGASVLCVAGYAFEKRASRMLARGWNGILKQYKLPFFHMVDCAHGNESFSSLTKKQRIKAATSLIGIVKRHAAHGFAVSVDTKAFREIMPSWGPTQSPYAFCARCIIDEIGRWFFKTGFRGKSAYFFEAGHQSRSEAEKVVGAVLTNPLAKLTDVHFGYVAHSFIGKKESAAVQAADLLAWHWATDVRHHMERRPRRKDFESLSQAPLRAVHFDRHRLVHYVELLKEFGVSESHETDTMLEHTARLLYIRERVKPSMSM